MTWPCSAASIDRTRDGTVTLQRSVGSVAMIVVQVFAHHPIEMPFVPNDHLVQIFPAQRLGHSLGMRVAPRGSWRNDFLLHTQPRDPAPERRIVNAITVAQEKLRCGLERDGVDQLLSSPETSRDSALQPNVVDQTYSCEVHGSQTPSVVVVDVIHTETAGAQTASRVPSCR
jgi:hypothetical protein